jgi:ADP-heptose:LPS heptosyltransferase
MTQERILIIRLGAFGDLVQCFDSFQAIRHAHPAAHITLLTTAPFVGFARMMPWFDAVQGRGRPRWNPFDWLALRRFLRDGKFTIVYDLQAKARTRRYARLIPSGQRPRWFAFDKKRHVPGHNIDRAAGIVADGGVKVVSGGADLSWLTGDIAAFDLKSPYAVLIPGCSPHLPQKRWPAESYAALAHQLQGQGFQVLAVGTKADAAAVEAIRQVAPFVRDLVGQTDPKQLGAVLRGAACVVGNDTGPTFLAAMLGAPTLMLMSAHTDPAKAAPRGPAAKWLKAERIGDLGVEQVTRDLETLFLRGKE